MELPGARNPGIEGRFELDSVHLGDIDTIKKESELALADVKEELEVNGSCDAAKGIESSDSESGTHY
jgi:hypothetical protein